MPIRQGARCIGAALGAPAGCMGARGRDSRTIGRMAIPPRDRRRPTRPAVPPDFTAAFGWHPEPELIGIRDPDRSRDALAAAGAATWGAGLDYLYDHAFDRAMGADTGWDDLRLAWFGPTREPGPAPTDPVPLSDVLEEFRVRVAPHTVSAYHPRSFGYFTPPPLVASIVGEVLSQFAQQGVDIWHAGPIAAAMEEEVVRWLCDVLGYDRSSFGILTSGGVMANFIGLALVRDAHVPALLGLDRPPRGRALEGLRVYAGDQGHFSIGRALDELGFPPETLVSLAADDDFRLRGATVAAAIDADRARGLTPIAIAAVAGSTNTGAVDAIGSSRTSRGASSSGSMSTPRTVPVPAFRGATPRGCPISSRRTR